MTFAAWFCFSLADQHHLNTRETKIKKKDFFIWFLRWRWSCKDSFTSNTASPSQAQIECETIDLFAFSSDRKIFHLFRLNCYFFFFLTLLFSILRRDSWVLQVSMGNIMTHRKNLLVLKRPWWKLDTLLLPLALNQHKILHMSINTILLHSIVT
jgi:hypothetical protein